MNKTRISAYKVREDIRAGMDERSGMGSERLMTKYRLNAEGVQSLFQDLDRAGLLRGTAEQDGCRRKWSSASTT